MDDGNYREGLEIKLMASLFSYGAGHTWNLYLRKIQQIQVCLDWNLQWEGQENNALLNVIS